ncbi:MAG: ATP-binding cassette domain-containing protein [Burkholderiaceae bacterium]|nr:MAG: ATP-binding cassette domain-containing protein [Burkholderiaceae bacterium]TBR75648.1 MAG: ATP-binding cassette domain-containing protein [Burkholderiaceae bacterium]
MTLEVQVNQLTTASAVLIRHLRLQVPGGVIHTVMGPSGSGKSSLLAAVCGLLADGLQFDGTIALNGRALLDEPFSRLDTALRERMRSFVFERVRQRQIPVLLVTHDVADVADAAQLTRL